MSIIIKGFNLPRKDNGEYFVSPSEVKGVEVGAVVMTLMIDPNTQKLRASLWSPEKYGLKESYLCEEIEPNEDLISRQEVIEALFVNKEMLNRVLDNTDVVSTDREKYSWGLGLIESNIEDIEELPSAQQTLYGYSIEHLALIARVMQKKNVTPEKAIDCFNDIETMMQMLIDERREIIMKAVKEYEG